MTMDEDGGLLLSSRAVGDVLVAAVHEAGGTLLRWRMDHVDHQPGRGTTATYRAHVAWDWGEATEIVGVTARVGGADAGDRASERVYHDAEGHEVTVWIYPADPELPGLASAAYAEGVAELVNDHGLWIPQGGALAGKRPYVSPGDIRLDVVGYRPRQRAVLRADVHVGEEMRRFYLKVQTAEEAIQTVGQHRLLRGAGIPAPEVLALTEDSVVVLEGLPGRPLTSALFREDFPCSAEELIAVLDAFPPVVARLPRRLPWTESVHYYVGVVARALPELEPRLLWLADQVSQGLAGLPAGEEATHGDFHEGQVHVSGGRVCGILDIDAIGPGRRADDLGCLLAHLSTIQRMDAAQAAHLQGLLEAWTPVFDRRVDPTELRLRAAGVAISLATGPHRSQEAQWREETIAIISAAEALVRQSG
ncbi:Ser/Thr protein kinase RdoA involved in Cpx stress response, MazF antagonist [Raineyella antarctica]|uniref:Ser/Thr protein kinase RdoA involved in Cpx stress response, MazF antagonist n=1 Tax=Raineyella antarctica TaxID=1577474 RepID=A0A1G6H4P2_9ACTN|nr:aminoglycoside phosphotransferase family protein [Raineyella antarctica]SDB89239.1 Ser/Thr protein kinase RdoA involved in Cpx stress response, MazF antagonist [Raineyella antarctica]